MLTIYRYFSIILGILVFSCRGTQVQNLPPDEYMYNSMASGPEIEISFVKGEAHNYPLMAIWAEDEAGNFIQTIYVSESIGKGVFKRGDASTGRWLPGEIRRPASLPYWAHRRDVRASDGLYVPDPRDPVPDAFTGPTPPADFVIRARLESAEKRILTLYFEINQTWDWNEYWTNNKFPDDAEYKTSCQPALVYSTMIDLDRPRDEYFFKVIGHSHWSGKTGELFTDLSTITTALDIAKEISVRVKN